MSDYGFFWNSRDGDRKYNADDFATWLRKFFTSGVFNGELFVSAAGGMTVSVDSGYANVDGKVMFFEDPQTFTLDVAHSTLPRVDTVVVEADYAERVISCKVVKGEPGGRATPPERTTEIYQLVLAQIAVRAGATQITQANITDTRWDESLCGYVAGTVDEMSWDEITAQWQAYLSEFQADQLDAWNTWIAAREGEYTTWTAAQQALYTAWIANQQEDFLAWYDRMKDQLSEDAAGHLQEEIDDLRSISVVTLSAEGWENKQYDLNDMFPDTEYDIEVFPFNGMTDAQFSAWQGSESTSNYLTNAIIARGTVPLIDIPVIVMSFKRY